jgi:hypothetical protein
VRRRRTSLGGGEAGEGAPEPAGAVGNQVRDTGPRRRRSGEETTEGRGGATVLGLGSIDPDDFGPNPCIYSPV